MRYTQTALETQSQENDRLNQKVTQTQTPNPDCHKCTTNNKKSTTKGSNKTIKKKKERKNSNLIAHFIQLFIIFYQCAQSP